MEDQFIAHYDPAGDFRYVKQPARSDVDSSLNLGSEDSPVEVLPMRLIYNDAARTMTFTSDFQGTVTLDQIMLDSGDARHAFVAMLPVGGNPTDDDITIEGIVNRANGTPVAGATLTLSGSLQATATTGSDGHYRFTVGASGVYQLSVAARGLRFSPAQRSFGSTAANQTADFTALPIKGRTGFGSRSR